MKHTIAPANRMAPYHGRAASMMRWITAAIVLALAPSLVFAQGTIIPWVPQQFTDTSNRPLNNAKICTYVAGTSTPLATYSNVGLTVANANPIRTDSGGYPTSGAIYLLPVSYKFILLTAGADNTCSTGTQIWSRDFIPAIPTASGNVDLPSQTAGEAIAIGDVVYLSDGSGALVGGRWYKADADLTYASSLASLIGIAPAAIASGSTGTIRIAGRTADLSGLTAGSIYYVSATAGGVTATAPANRRLLGGATSTTTLDFDANPSTLLNLPQAADVQVFTGSGTWTKPSGVRNVRVLVIGGGGGGGSGRRGAAGTDRYGGTGGGGGGYADQTFAASSLGATETVTIGAGGAGGAAVAVDSTNGNAGVAGGASSFGSWLRASGGAAGGIGQAAAPIGAVPGGLLGGGYGLPTELGGTSYPVLSADGTGGGGGGGGGRITAGDALAGATYGTGGANTIFNRAGGTSGGAVDGTAGGVGTASPSTGATVGGGGGGGGGAPANAAAGGAGGAGGNYGGGGGGGGPALNGRNSGAGGAGAGGAVVVISW